MAHRVADELVNRLEKAGVEHIYGVVGDSLNPDEITKSASTSGPGTLLRLLRVTVARIEGGRDAHYRLRFAFATADVGSTAHGNRRSGRTRPRARGEQVREYYSGLPGPVRVGIEASCATQWFLQLMKELRVQCWVGHPAKIRAYEPRKQKNDRRDARLLRHLSAQDIFPWLQQQNLRSRVVAQQ